MKLSRWLHLAVYSAGKSTLFTSASGEARTGHRPDEFCYKSFLLVAIPLLQSRPFELHFLLNARILVARLWNKNGQNEETEKLTILFILLAITQLLTGRNSTDHDEISETELPSISVHPTTAIQTRNIIKFSLVKLGSIVCKLNREQFLQNIAYSNRIILSFNGMLPGISWLDRGFSRVRRNSWKV